MHERAISNPNWDLPQKGMNLGIFGSFAITEIGPMLKLLTIKLNIHQKSAIWARTTIFLQKVGIQVGFKSITQLGPMPNLCNRNLNITVHACPPPSGICTNAQWERQTREKTTGEIKKREDNGEIKKVICTRAKPGSSASIYIYIYIYTLACWTRYTAGYPSGGRRP